MNKLTKQITENILECNVTTIKQLNSREIKFIELEDVLRLLRIFGKPEDDEEDEMRLFGVTTGRTDHSKPNISAKPRPNYSLGFDPAKEGTDKTIELRPRRAGKNDEYIKHWMNNLISIKTIVETEFSDWIEGFQERYTGWEIMLMKDIWWARKERIFSSLNDKIVVIKAETSTSLIYKRLVHLFKYTTNNHHQMTEIIHGEFQDKITREDAVMAVDYFAKHLTLKGIDEPENKETSNLDTPKPFWKKWERNDFTCPICNNVNINSTECHYHSCPAQSQYKG